MWVRISYKDMHRDCPNAQGKTRLVPVVGDRVVGFSVRAVILA